MPGRPGTRGLVGGVLFQCLVRVHGALPVLGALTKLEMHSLISWSGRRLRFPLTASSVPLLPLLPLPPSLLNVQQAAEPPPRPKTPEIFR